MNRSTWWRIRTAFLRTVLPDDFFFAEYQLTHSARMLLRRLGLGLVIVALGVAGLLLLNRNNWQDVAAGAALAWTVSLMAWAISSYRENRDVVTADLRRNAELDFLHARLNHIANKIGVPMVNLVDNEIDDAVQARVDRLAHLMGLEEFGRYADGQSSEFWDNVAMGFPSTSSEEEVDERDL